MNMAIFLKHIVLTVPIPCVHALILAELVLKTLYHKAKSELI